MKSKLDTFIKNKQKKVKKEKKESKFGKKNKKTVVVAFKPIDEYTWQGRN